MPRMIHEMVLIVGPFCRADPELVVRARRAQNVRPKSVPVRINSKLVATSSHSAR